MNKKEDYQENKYLVNPGYHWDMYKKNSYYKTLIDYAVGAIPNKSRVIDIGCGDGVLSGLLFKNKNCNVTGIDISKEAIKFAKGNVVAPKFLCFNLSEYSRLNTSKFDWAVSLDVIEHLDNPKYILELMRCGYRKIIGTPEKREKCHPSHVKEYTVEELEETVSKYFKVIKIDKMEIKKGDKIANYLFLFGE